jgi:hypothetical protein
MSFVGATGRDSASLLMVSPVLGLITLLIPVLGLRLPLT